MTIRDMPLKMLVYRASGLQNLIHEEENNTDLKFYRKGIASDNYRDFVDRPQELYQQ